MGHDAVFINNLLLSFQGRFLPFLQGYNNWKRLITLFRRIEIRFWNVALENVEVRREVCSMWKLPQVSMVAGRKTAVSERQSYETDGWRMREVEVSIG